MPSILKTDSACSSQTVHCGHRRASHSSTCVQRLPQQLDDVLIVERVEDLPAGAARADQAHAAQQAQLVRDRRLADAHERRDVADAELAACQRVENPHPRRVAEDAKGLGQRLDASGDISATPGSSARRAAQTAASTVTTPVESEAESCDFFSAGNI